MSEDKILVSLGEGQSLQDLARGLLAVADHPHDVETAPRQGGFMVPESLAARYAQAAQKSTGEAAAEEKPRARRSRRAAPAKRDASATAETPADSKKAGNKTAKAKTSGARPARTRSNSRSATKGGAKGDGGVSDA